MCDRNFEGGGGGGPYNGNEDVGVCWRTNGGDHWFDRRGVDRDLITEKTGFDVKQREIHLSRRARSNIKYRIGERHHYLPGA